MNAFFSFTETGWQDFPLRELARSLEKDPPDISALDKSVVKELAEGAEGPFWVVVSGPLE